MKKERIDELREWLDGQISVEPFLSPVVTSRVAKENAVNLADLLASLSDYQVALPLLEAAKKAETTATGTIQHYWREQIIARAIAYKERSGG
ncbi:MAG: hypothetical protein ABIH23_27835 [bacterium]